MHRNVVHIDADILRAQRLENLAAVRLQLHSIKPDRIQMPRRIDLGSNRRRNDLRDLAKCGRITFRDLPAPRQIRLQLLQLLNAQGTSNVGQPVVEAQQHHLVMPLPGGLPLPRVAADAVIAKAAQRLGELRIVGRDHAAFPGRDVLHRMKAEDGHVRQAADPTALVLGAQSVAGIFDHHQPMALGQFEKRSQVRGMPGIIHRQNGLRSRSNARCCLFGIKIQRVRRDVGKDRNALPDRARNLRSPRRSTAK